jgi:hypothetical protein
MRAILRTRFGGPDVLEIRQIPEPKADHGPACKRPDRAENKISV